jgi:hypothetical protein
MRSPQVLSFILVSSLTVAATSRAEGKRVAINSDALAPALASGPMADAPAAPDAPAPAPRADQPYASPFMGRGVKASTGARFDTSTAPFTKAEVAGVASTFLLSGAYAITPSAGISARIGMDRVVLPGAEARVGFLNPSIGGMYGWKLGRSFRLATTLTATLPVGSGGGDAGDADLVAAHKAASLARGAMEGAMFAVNDLTLGYAADLAYVDHGFTVQLGSQITTGFRARGAEVQKDTTKVNSTSSLALGYFVFPALSLGTELREQAYVSTPTAVAKDPTARQNLSFAVGARGHVQLAKKVWMRPGINYSQGLVGPMEKAGYHAVGLDLPFSF